MQKITMTTLILALSIVVSFSQDIILKKSGDDIAEILEIGTTEIRYKDFGNEEGPIHTLLKSEIFMIKYKNGAKEIFAEEEVIENTIEYSEEELLAKGKQDATIHYRGRKAGAGATIATTVLLTPLIGIIPALACESTKPSFKNLNFPDGTLMQNESYHQAYEQQAHRIKKKKIWKSFGIGSGVWLLILLL